MNTPLVSNRHPVVSLLYIIILVGVGFLLIGPLVGVAVTSLFYEGDLMQAMKNPDYSGFLPIMVMQGFASFIGLIVMPLLYIGVFERKSIGAFFKLNNPPVAIPVIMLIGFGFLVVLSPVIEWNMNLQFPEFMKEFAEWARQREDALMEVTKALTNFQSIRDLLIGLVVIAVLAGIGEELVFRGLIQNELKRGTGNPHVAIWVAAILFSAIHMQFFGFVPRVLLGALFGYLYHWSGNLWVPMFAHFFHNGFTVLMIYFYQQGITGFDMESEEAAPWYWVLVSMVFTFALLVYFRKLYATKTSFYTRE
ncbi:MAG: CPBP family intramembrane metalloprotease [Cyclobacteriaceae bacterium]|nr:CPBP family intramembrane metalloprotease [Cyclobacteriaceae bacterium]